MKKEKFNIEYILKSVNPQVLWNYIGTSSGLADWFADDVQTKGKRYSFIWNKISQEADQIGCRTGVFIRFKWLDEEDSKPFFEFRIHQMELTNYTVLEITDFAYPDEIKDNIDLWNKQILALKHILGL